jgi:hypothetical protein
VIPMTKPHSSPNDPERTSRRSRILRAIAAGGARDTHLWFAMVQDLRPIAPRADVSAPAAATEPASSARWFSMAQDLRDARTSRDDWADVEVSTFRP